MLEQLILWLLKEVPLLLDVIVVVGSLRLVIKPIVAGIRAVTAVTPSTKDDALADKIEASGWYKSLVFVLDWLASLKLPGAK